jgi:hypothetical protein
VSRRGRTYFGPNDPLEIARIHSPMFDDDKFNMVYLENGWSIRKENHISYGRY